MNDELISELVDRTGVISDTDLVLDRLNKIEKAIQRVNGLEIKLNGVSAGNQVEQITKDLAAANKYLEATTKDLTTITKQQAEAQLTLAKANRENEKAQQEALKTQKLKNDESERAAKVTLNEQKMIDEIGNDYKQLNKALKDAEDRYKSLALTKGFDNEQTIIAQKQALGIRDVLDKVDQGLRNYQRGVGNYASGFDSLKNSMQQLLRETPSLAINLQTFFLAISNNLPIFFDAVSQAQKANATIAASGQATVPVFGQIAKGLFSVQTALTVGVTLLTLYGSKIVDWVKGLFTAVDATAQLNRKLDDYNKLIEDSKKRTESLNDQLSFLQKLSRINIDIDVQKAPQLDKLGGDLEDLRQLSIDQTNTTAELNDELSKLKVASADAFHEFFTSIKDVDPAIENLFHGTRDLNSVFSEVGDKLPESSKKAFETYTKLDKAVEETNKAVRKSGETQNLVYKQIALKKGDIDKEQSAQTRKLILESINAEADIRKTSAEKILNDERSSFDQRNAALKSFNNAERAIIEGQKNDVLANPESSPEEKKAAILKANAAIISANNSLNEKLFSDDKARALRSAEAEEKIFVLQKQQLADRYDQLSTELELPLQSRLELIKNYADAERAILDKENELQKKQDAYKFLTNEEKLQQDRDYENKVLQLSIGTNKRITENIRLEIEKQQAIRAEDIDTIKALYSRIDLNTSTLYSQDVIDLNTSLAAKKISIDTYNEQRRKLDDAFAADSLQNLENSLREQLSKYDGFRQKLLAEDNKLNDLRQQLADAASPEEQKRLADAVDTQNKIVEVTKTAVGQQEALAKQLTGVIAQEADSQTGKTIKALDKRIEKTVFYLNSIGQLFSSISQIQDNGFTRRLNAIDDEKTALSDRYDHEKSLIEQSVLSQTEKQTKLAALDKRNAAQQKVLDQQAKEEKKKQAIFDKEAAIMNIIIAGAEAVVRDLKEPYKIPIDIAVTAAELAVAISAPLPRFFKGKNATDYKGSMDSYEGLAWTGDGGKSELIIHEDGSKEITPNTPTLTYVKAKDIILPDASLALANVANGAVKKSANNSVINNQVVNLNDGVEKAIHGMKSAVVKAVKNIPQTVIKTENPMKAWVRSGETSREFLNRYRGL